MEILTIIILVVLAGIVLWSVGIFNSLVKLKNRAKEAWSDISVQLKRRYDLIPNLVETVKAYAKHEKELFENVAQLRAKAMMAEGAHDKAEAENMLSATLKSLFAVSESYPQLKASNNFLELQRELTDTENKIQAARRFYNTNVRDLNIKIESFPDSIFAKMFGFLQMELFELSSEAEKKPVKVGF